MTLAVRSGVGLIAVVLLSAVLVVLEQPPAAATGRWEDAGFPSEVAVDYPSRHKISAAGPDDAWAVVDKIPWHWDGQRWQARPVTDGANPVRVERIAAVPDGTAWVSGQINRDRRREPWTGRWEGSGWTALDPPQLFGNALRSTSTVLDFEATGPDDVWLLYYVSPPGAERHAVVHFDGVSWNRIGLRGPGCGFFDVLPESPVLTLRRGEPVVSGTCSGSDRYRFIWQLKDGRWADRGVVEHDFPRWAWQLEVRPGGGLVLFDPSLRPWLRARTGEWTRLDPVSLENFDAGATDVDPTNGAILAAGRYRWCPRCVPRTSEPTVCVRRTDGSDHCRRFRAPVTLHDVDVDPVSGSRWVLGSGPEGVKVWAWRHAASPS